MTDKPYRYFWINGLFKTKKYDDFFNFLTWNGRLVHTYNSPELALLGEEIELDTKSDYLFQFRRDLKENPQWIIELRGDENVFYED